MGKNNWNILAGIAKNDYKIDLILPEKQCIIEVVMHIGEAKEQKQK